MRQATILKLLLCITIGLIGGQAVAGEKLDSHLRRLTRTKITAVNLDETGLHGYLKLRMVGDRPFVGILMHAGPGLEATLWRMGAVDIRRFGPVYAAEAPVGILRQLAARDDVYRLQAVRKLHPNLDVSVPDPVGLELDRSSIQLPGATGLGAIVGTVDTGIDPAHADFKTADGTGTRILYIWDQVNNFYCAPTDIAQGNCNHVDTDGHGTHVAGIAAGNGGPAGQYEGVAPEANIITVATTFYDDAILDGVAYIFGKAHELEMPAVVNLSLGGQDGPHDGSDPFDVGMDALAGPGQVVVAAAGNEGDPAVPIHQYAEHPVTTDVNLPFKFTDWDQNAYWGTIYITIWHRGSDSYRVQVKSRVTYDLSCPPRRNCSQKAFQGTSTLQIVNPATDEVEYNGEKQVGIYIHGYIDSGDWNLYLIADTPGSDTPHWMHSWIFYDDFYTTRFLNGDNQITVSSPGSAKSVITVGAQTTKTDWTDIDGDPQVFAGETIGDISSYSSRGPIRDGRLKPDVTAPGTVIGAAMTSEVPLSDPDYPYRMYILPDGEHWILMGTSMASPHITGLAAILLGADLSYTYTPAALKSILASSADRSSPVSAPGNTWGYGKTKANAAASLSYSNSPSFTGAANLPASATVDSTLIAAGTGFASGTGSSERFLYRWQVYNGSFFENIPGATYRRLEPQEFVAGNRIRAVATPYEYASGSGGYDGLLLGRSITAEQTIQSSASFTSHTDGEEWHMFSIPTVDDSTIMNDFMNPFWQWNEGLQDYEHATSILRGQGYWIYVEAGEGLLHSPGAAVPDEDFIVDLSYNTDPAAEYAGRHLLGNPFNQPIYWENIYVSTDPGNFTQLVTEASDLIHNVYFTDYNNTSGAYKQYDPNDFEERDGKIFPWEAFFVFAKQHIYLKIPVAQPAPAGSSSPGYYPLPVASVAHSQISRSEERPEPDRCAAGRSEKPWRLKISAASGLLRDDYNYIGIYPLSQAGYDPRDIPDAGTLNYDRHILLYLRHSDWGDLSENYCVDMRSSCNARRYLWEMTAEARGTTEPVTISWRKPPANWDLFLTDPVAGISIDMSRETSYRYVPNGDEDRVFQILARLKATTDFRQIFQKFYPTRR